MNFKWEMGNGKLSQPKTIDFQCGSDTIHFPFETHTNKSLPVTHRSRLKNCASMARQSSASTPPSQGQKWGKAGSSGMR